MNDNGKKGTAINKAIVTLNDGSTLIAIDMSYRPNLKEHLRKIWEWKGVKSVTNYDR